MGTSSTVTVNGNTYAVYGTFADANVKLGVAFSDNAVAWQAATATQQQQAMVEAARALDRQRWQGLPVTPPVPDVALQWPRSNVVDARGTPVDPTTIPNNIVLASYQLAAAIILDPSILDVALSGSNISEVAAGPVNLRFFRPTLGITGRFGTIIHELVGEYLAGSVASADGVGSASGITNSDGSAVTSSFDDSDAYDINRSI